MQPLILDCLQLLAIFIRAYLLFSNKKKYTEHYKDNLSDLQNRRVYKKNKPPYSQR